ncbi:MAG: glycosyltransferase family 1 protein [Blastopirellula sp.]|nr:MAG: glycosyltransferase family 1 protein [Blastopirellula sp.]
MSDILSTDINEQLSSNQIAIIPPSVVAANSGNQSTLTEKPTKTVNVLHLINGEHYSGAERVQDLLALRLPEFGYQVGFCCLKPDRFNEARAAKEAPLYDLGMRHRFDLLRTSEIARIATEGNYELLHAHTPRSVLLGMMTSRKTGIPLVYHVHSPTSRDSTRRVRNWVNQQVERMAMKHAVQLITVSHSLADHVADQGISREKISVVHNGVPTTIHIDQRTPPTKTWILGTVALFRPRKGIEVLLHAMAELRAVGNDVRLRAVGPFETPEYEASIKQLVKELQLEDAIEWVGFTQEVNQELGKMDLFVLPSLFGEGLPMVILESMAVGTPVVATKVEGVTEAIKHGVNGLIAKPEDPKSLAEQIQALILGLYDWNELRSNALVEHNTSFSDISMARGTSLVYDEILR